MPEQDIYKLVEQLNKDKQLNSQTKIDDIYNLLDEIKNDTGNIKTDINKESNETKRKKNLSDYKSQLVKPRKPDFPTMINAYDSRSECFFNLILAIDYGTNNEEYVNGHKTALEKYYQLVKINNKDLYVVEGKVEDEIKEKKFYDKNDNYEKGYYDGLEYVSTALERSKRLLAKKLSEILTKELG